MHNTRILKPYKIKNPFILTKDVRITKKHEDKAKTFYLMIYNIY